MPWTSALSEAPTVGARRAAVFYDGVAARRRAVLVETGPDALVVTEDGAELSRWRYEEVRRHYGPTDVMRLRNTASVRPERLEVSDRTLEDRIAELCPRLDEGTRLRRRTLATIVAASLAAAASLILTVTYLVPLAADRIVPLVPIALERRLGDAFDGRVRGMFGPAPCAASEGVAALVRLSARLADRAALPVPLQVLVLPSPIPNAFALAGGRVYVLDGLLRRAESVDELAGVLAHEMGHVAHRDGLRNVLRAGGSSALLGLLFGDVTGAGTVVLLGRMLVDTANSRHVETEADAFAARLMHALRRPAKPMGAFLVRLSRSSWPTLIPFLASHPVGADRLAALAAGDTPDNGPPLLTDEEWRSLKSVCKRG